MACVSRDSPKETESRTELSKASQQPARTPEVEYWRSVADMRARQPDAAAERLARVLDPAQWPAEAQADTIKAHR